MTLHVVMRGENVCLLFGDELTDGEREVLVERVGVGLFGFVLALLGCFEEGVVAASELRFEISPYTMYCAGGGAGLFDVVNAVLMEDLLEVAAKAGAFEGFGQEIALESVVFEVLADVGEALLAVEEAADESVERALHFMLFA
jgi:hypothetical protein